MLDFLLRILFFFSYCNLPASLPVFSFPLYLLYIIYFEVLFLFDHFTRCMFMHCTLNRYGTGGRKFLHNKKPAEPKFYGHLMLGYNIPYGTLCDKMSVNSFKTFFCGILSDHLSDKQYEQKINCTYYNPRNTTP